jgi:hypothetical protein
MTANHVEHEIATFPGSPGRAASSARGEAPFLPTQGLAAGSVSDDRQRVNESPGGEAGASRRKYVQRGLVLKNFKVPIMKAVERVLGGRKTSANGTSTARLSL